MLNYNARLGLIMFGLYLLLYGGFVLVNAFAPESMEQTWIGGVSLAVSWGFGLILGAVVLSFIYGFLCRTESTETTTRQEKP